MEIRIKQATSDDVKMLSFIAQSTFLLACPSNSCKKEISEYIKNNFNELVFQMLVKSDEVFIACAQVNGVLVGFVVMKYLSSQPNNQGLNNSAELQRLYVLREYHGTNVSMLLVSEVLKKCSQTGIGSIWLSVYSENNRAKKFYSKLGFQEAGTTYFRMGNEKHLDNVMVANIV